MVLAGCCTALALLAGCGVKTPLQPVNRDPIVTSLTVFPTTIAPGDSAVVVCSASDPDGESVRYDWHSYGAVRLNSRLGWIAYSQPSNSMTIYASAGTGAPSDTGWVRCFAVDDRGGSQYAGMVEIVIQP